MSSTAPTASRSMQLRVVALMSFCSLSSLLLFAAAALVSARIGLNAGAFLAADVGFLLVRRAASRKSAIS